MEGVTTRTLAAGRRHSASLRHAVFVAELKRGVRAMKLSLVGAELEENLGLRYMASAL